MRSMPMNSNRTSINGNGFKGALWAGCTPSAHIHPNVWPIKSGHYLLQNFFISYIPQTLSCIIMSCWENHFLAAIRYQQLGVFLFRASVTTQSKQPIFNQYKMGYVSTVSGCTVWSWIFITCSKTQRRVSSRDCSSGKSPTEWNNGAGEASREGPPVSSSSESLKVVNSSAFIHSPQP